MKTTDTNNTQGSDGRGTPVSGSSLEILHRAKMQRTGFWFYGFYTGCEFFIVEKEQGIAEIDESSVGVYINKQCASTGEKLFTGDLVVINDGSICMVVFDDFNSRFALKSSPSSSGIRKMESCRLIGNIFDNPEKFVEPISAHEIPSKTPTSESFTKRNHRESLRGCGLR